MPGNREIHEIREREPQKSLAFLYGYLPRVTPRGGGRVVPPALVRVMAVVEKCITVMKYI